MAQSEPGWKPTERVEVVVGVSPGGSMDRTARAVRDALVKGGFISQTSVVVNKPGGGHSVAYSYTARQKGNPHVIQVTGMPILTNRLLGRSPINYKEFTPLGVVFSEKTAFAVRTESPIKDARDLVDRLKLDPAGISFSVSSGVGTVQYFSVAQIAKSLGLELKKLKTVSFKGSSEGITATLGGHVDVLATAVGTIAPFVESKQLRFIALAADERMTDEIMANVPTWREVGVDASFDMWRAVIAPKNLTAPQIKFWEGALKAITMSDEWKKLIEEQQLSARYNTAAETAALMDKEDKMYHELLSALGLLAVKD
ncbi:tripartite tricarboxylate transporter substrate binding protein [Xanthobacteraceae bacterium Astr-EGSB]|uniref:tripartite tricarboxylate transporter substrate binding protein n=1 Tax=Astrobacterium formosum TaxID=3069710 RepID=UPI0027AFBF64|nr:tripartite tricarboxylate transporter substrate binding protein [Xanthobacteraceae bacterium Astr-EGSB]